MMLPLILLPDLCTLPISSNFHLCTKAIQKEKYEAYIGKFEAFGVYVKRLSPRLIHWLVSRSKVK